MCQRVSKHRFPVVDGVPVLLGQAKLSQFFKAQASGNNRQGRKAAVGGEYHWKVYSIDEFLPEIPDGEVLLVGCGDAGEKPYLEKRGFRSIGCDIVPVPGADFYADVHNLPVRDECFDVVLSMQVLEHLPEPWTAVEQVVRVLRPGGWFVGSVAFLKPYHTSYYHMSHLAVLHLLESHGLRVTKLEGAQSVAFSILSALLPVGSASFRRSFWGTLERWLFRMRLWAWSLRTRLDPDAVSDRFGAGMPMSARTFDKLRFAPAVVFAAQKPLSGEEVSHSD